MCSISVAPVSDSIIFVVVLRDFVHRADANKCRRGGHGAGFGVIHILQAVAW